MRRLHDSGLLLNQLDQPAHAVGGVQVIVVARQRAGEFVSLHQNGPQPPDLEQQGFHVRVAMAADGGVSCEHWLGDQVALEALMRLCDEELKHLDLFRCIEGMVAAQMPAGYTFAAEPNAVASAVLSKSSWAVLTLTCHIELFTQQHYRENIAPDENPSNRWEDVFFFHWKEESQHVILDELEWSREDARLTPEARDQAVTDLIELLGALDGSLRAQSAADAEYFVGICGRALSESEQAQVSNTVLKAYRRRYIASGVRDPRFAQRLGDFIDAPQSERIGAALKPILPHVDAT